MKRFLPAVTTFCFLLGVLGLAANHHTAGSMANQIITADNAGQDTASFRATLESFVHSHMGSSVSFKLNAGYQRAMAGSQAAAVPQVSGQVYAQAQAACASHADSIAQANCVKAFVASHGGNTPPPVQPVKIPDQSDYAFSFHSPLWTPDVAGLAWLAAACGGLLSLWLSLFR